jgi:hypothetical protein
MLSSISNKIQSNQELSRISSDANFSQGGIKVISKKLISFRSQSKSGEKKHKIEFRNSNKLSKMNNNNQIKVKMNQTQPFGQALNQTPNQGSYVSNQGQSISHRSKPYQIMDTTPVNDMNKSNYNQNYMT